MIKKVVLGKLKGSSFERTICKKLSLWVSKNKRDDIFWRTNSSGGRYTVRKKVGLDTYNQAGDITNAHPEGEFLVNYFIFELKSYKKINIWDFFKDQDKKTLLYEWWIKLNNECKNCNKIPILIVKEDYKPVLLLTNSYFGNFLETHFNFHIRIIWKLDQEINIGLFDDLLKIDADCFKEKIQSDLLFLTFKRIK
ncbi:MAG: hypothetical protein WBJ84_10645 [Bacteroidales bacterium]